MVQLVRENPGILRTELEQLTEYGEGSTREAIDNALERRLIHKRPTPVQRADGVTRHLQGLYLKRGPRRPTAPDRITPELVQTAVGEVEREPGLSSRTIADRLPCGAHLARQIVMRALEEGRVHGQLIQTHDANGRTVIRSGLVPGPAPGRASNPAGLPLTVDELRAERDRLGYRSGECANSPAPAHSRPAIGAAHRPRQNQLDPCASWLSPSMGCESHRAAPTCRKEMQNAGTSGAGT